MKPKDTEYLKNQFWLKIHRKNGKEFQTFFESIMKCAFQDFELVKPYGRTGDKKNDGFRKKAGIYYQVYAPENPEIKLARAAKKTKEDFRGLYESWQAHYEIREFHFVFNDKELGTAPEINMALAELSKEFPNVEFDVLTSKKLERIFLELREEDVVGLGFSLDSREAISNMRNYLKSIEVDLDRNNPELAVKSLQKVKKAIERQGDENLELEFEILECLALQRIGRIQESKEKYKSLIKRYPDDVRSLCYLAEAYLSEGNFELNEKLLNQAEKINADHWLWKIEMLSRKYHLKEMINLSEIDESLFPEDNRSKSIFYRIYALFYEMDKDHRKADEYIEKAIHLNPDRFSNYDVKLGFQAERLLALSGIEKEYAHKEYLQNIDMTIKKFQTWEYFSIRNMIYLNHRKLGALLTSDEFTEIERLGEDILLLILNCHFDIIIDRILSSLLKYVLLPDKQLEALLGYLRKYKDDISHDLSNSFLFQFARKGQLQTRAREFFKTLENTKAIKFIENVEKKNIEGVVEFLIQDTKFMVSMANSLTDIPDLREEIIRRLPEEKDLNIDRVWLLFYYETRQYEKAFEILKTQNLSKIEKYEFGIFLEIAHQMEAWEMELMIIEQALKLDFDEVKKIRFRLRLFSASFNLGRYSEAIEIGESLLKERKTLIEYMNAQNREILLGQTIFASLRRGENEKAQHLIKEYHEFAQTYEFKISVEVETYLKNNDGEGALRAVIEGAKKEGSPTPEQFAHLFPILLQINELSNISLNSDNKVTKNCFVKIEDQDRWFFLGDECELDATKIQPSNSKYSSFIGKKIGDSVEFPDDKYHSLNRIIQNILPIEGYIFLRSHDYFCQLSREGIWEQGWIIEVPKKSGILDLSNVITFVKDKQKQRDDFFDFYCEKDIPLALLAANQDGLVRAIGKIQQENRGFIHILSGKTEEYEKQKEIARKMVAGDTAYLDGTSALFLSELGILEHILSSVPNLRIPQSVINYLFEVSDQFSYIPGQVGLIGFSRGALQISQTNQKQQLRIKDNIVESIKYMESKPEKISVISKSNKRDVFTEQQIPAEIVDACIMAQKDNAVVLTDDFLYLQANSLETGKRIPAYCSSFILMRILLDDGKIRFSEYLDYFSYLSFYRCRFLPVSIDDLIRAIFGDGKIIIVAPENIEKFNLSLVLSEEYGVSPWNALQVMGVFLGRILVDDSITLELAERIFAEIVTSFLRNRNRLITGKLLIAFCQLFIQQYQRGIAVGFKAKRKLKALEGQIKIFSADIDVLK